MEEDLKSFYIAIVLSVIAILTINYFFPKPEIQDITVNEQAEVPTENVTTTINDTENPVIIKNTEIQKPQPEIRLPLQNKDVSGSILLNGLRFDNLALTKYKQTLDADSPNINLFTKAKEQNSFYAEYGWLSTSPDVILPDKNTLWTAEGNDKLTPTTPVKLVWENGQGLKFIYNISLDENYMFTIEQAVENNSDKTVSLIPYGLLRKHAATDGQRSGVVHEGFTGIIDGDLQEIRYDKINDETENFATTGGWISFTEKYWFGAFIFNDTYQAKVALRKVNDEMFQLDFKGTPLTIAADSSGSVNTKLFAGAKEIKLLDKYAESIKKFDLAVDFGWYYFITKPFFYILDFLYRFIGNMGWAILLFAALLRVLMFPIANKSYENMSKMKKVQPKLLVLQEMYKDDKLALQRATMELYQREKVNPASGCLPMFIQIPIFFSLYKVLNIAIEIRHAPFIGWIKDLSAPDPLTISVWSHIYIPSMLDIGVWPLIYGLTMLLQQKLNPAPANKDQARMFALMPIIFMIMFAHFAVGLVIYWTLSNILSLIQQKTIMYKNGVK